MFDRFDRRISYLRVSVTDKCNLRCKYCMPEEGIQMLRHDQILNFDEITEVVKEAVKLGVNKVRITGGEPLVRRGIVDLVHMIAQVPGIDDLAMTTNAILLDQFAKPLKEAGLHRVNVSLDTMNPEDFKEITRGGDFSRVMQGLKVAQEIGLTPIKVNCVIKKSSNEPHAQEVAKFCEENGYHVRFIQEMDLEEGDFSVVEGGEGGDCSNCNRLRLTADGHIAPCLFSNLMYNVRELGAKEAILKAVDNKPSCGSENNINKFHNIGG